MPDDTKNLNTNLKRLSEITKWFDNQEDEIFIVMELAESDLSALIEKKNSNFSIQNKIFILLQISSALQFLHKIVSFFFF